MRLLELSAESEQTVQVGLVKFIKGCECPQGPDRQMVPVACLWSKQGFTLLSNCSQKAFDCLKRY